LRSKETETGRTRRDPQVERTREFAGRSPLRPVAVVSPPRLAAWAEPPQAARLPLAGESPPAAPPRVVESQQAVLRPALGKI